MNALFIALSFGACFAGGSAPAVDGLIRRLGLPRVLAFRSGLLIAVAGGDVLPHAWQLAPVPAATAFALAVALGLFLHGVGEEHAGHDHSHPHVHGAGARLPAIGALLVHSLLDGVNLGAAALVGGPALLAVGCTTAMHKLADGFTLASLFGADERRRGVYLALLAGLSLATPFGAVFARAGELLLGPNLSALLLGYAGGSFLYVGAADVLPRLLRRRDGGSALSFGGGLAAIFALRKLGS